MARSDRLFDLIGLIRDGRLHRARDLAAYLAAMRAWPEPGGDGVTCSAFQPLASRR